MEILKEFEAFENAMADALKSGVISIENAYINDDGKNKSKCNH